MQEKDFRNHKEKGVIDCDKQVVPIHLLELFGGIGAPRRALENVLSKKVKEENPGFDKNTLKKEAAKLIKSIDYVKNLEKRINAIAEGKDSLESFISDMQADFNSMLKELKGNRSSKLVQHYPDEKLNTDMICPCCGKAIANVGWGYSCTGWKKDGSGCNFAIGNKQYGKTISEKIVKQLINNKKSSVALKGLKKKNGETFKSAAYLTLDIMPDGRAKVGFTFE